MRIPTHSGNTHSQSVPVYKRSTAWKPYMQVHASIQSYLFTLFVISEFRAFSTLSLGAMVEGWRGSLHGKAKSVGERKEEMEDRTLEMEVDTVVQQMNAAVWGENALERTDVPQKDYHICAGAQEYNRQTDDDS